MKKSCYVKILTAGLCLAILQTVLFLLPLTAQGAVMEQEEEEVIDHVAVVSDVEELIEYWEDDMTLVLEPGEYNITEYLRSLSNPPRWNYDGINEKGLYYTDEFDGPEMIACGYSNITIVSADRENPASIVCEPRYADVLSFNSCYNIIIDGIIAGHTPEKGSCAGDVISLEECSNVTVTGCDLYGCGTYAFTIDSCYNVSAIDCNIHDCSYGCVTAWSTEGLRFIRSDFHDCREFTMFELSGGTTDFIACDFRNLDGGFISSGSGKVSFTGCSYDDPIREELTEKGYIAEKNSGKEHDSADDGEITGLISYTAKDQPVELWDDDDNLAVTNYYELLLDEDSKEAYPALAKKLDEINASEKKRAKESAYSMEEESRLMKEMNPDMYFSSEKTLIPTRADSKAFSYVYRVYEYLGGAHGFSYPAAVNIDPATGESIAFNAVVKDTEKLPDIMYDELIKQNDDLVEYFSYDESGVESLKADNIERLKNDGEGLCWSLAYDGLWIYYEDYAMGSYVAGSREELIRFDDYPEIFTDTYRIKGTSIPVIDKQVETRTGDTVKLESKKHSVHTIPLSWHMETFSPENSDNPGYYYYTYAEEYGADESFEGLKKNLDSFNKESEKNAENSLKNLGNYAQKDYKEKGDDAYRLYEAGTRLCLRRADENYVSFAVYEEAGDSVKALAVVSGKNIDTRTGEDVELSDIITDDQALIEAVGEELKKVFYDEEIRAGIMKEFAERLDDESTVSGKSLAWCLGYEGMELYLNPEVNYDFYGDMDQVVKLFIGFDTYGKLFKDRVKTIPLSYVYEPDLSEHFYVDTDNDGKLSEFSAALIKDVNGDYSGMNLSCGDDKWEFEEGVFGYSAEAYLVHDYMENDYLYLCLTGDNDYSYVSVFSLGEEPAYEGEKDGSLKFEIPFDEEGGHGYMMTGPNSFYMICRDDTMGTRSVIGEYQSGWNGVPVLSGYYQEYIDNGSWDVRAALDIKADIVDENGNTISESVLKKGEAVAPYRINEWGGLLVKTKDGTIWRISLEENEDSMSGWAIEGKPVNECFDGLAYAG